MAFHITQCPCCNSTFSISTQLLHAANGKVRCGACLSVFLAEQQLVDSEPETDGSETNDSVFVGHAPEDYFDPASFLTREALQQQSINCRIATAESEVSEAEHAGPNTHDRSPKEAFHGLARNPEGPEPDNGQARAPLKPEKLPRCDAAATPFPDPVTEQHADAANSSDAIRARALRMKLKDEQAPERFDAENLASLQAVATPVQLHSDSPTRWGRTLTQLLSAGLLGMILAGQHLWRNQEFYSQQARWRPLLEWVCADRGCGLPLYEDLPAIEPSNLSVRSHPNRADAIMVQMQIRNTAPFEQGFPVMIVGFNTADNELIALREFSPAEYLQGELPESATMPVMAPVPINLPLMDPGEDAVNYTLAFRRP